MALLPDRDLDAPVISWAMQINAVDKREVAIFALKKLSPPSYSVHLNPDTILAAQDHAIVELCGAIQFTQRFLSDVFLHQNVGANLRLFREFNEWYTRVHSDVVAVPGVNEFKDFPEDKMFGLHQVKFENVQHGYARTVILSLYALMHRMVEQPGVLKMCEECRSLYESNKAEQAYCSNRCANRVSQRKRDQKKREISDS